MKHKLLFLSLLGSSALMSQPTITGFVNPVIGTSDVTNSYDASLHTQGSDGANVTWDFSSIASSGTSSSVFKDPANVPEASNFIGTTIVAEAGGNKAFAKGTATEWTMIGTIIGTFEDNYSTDPRELLKFPLTYQTVYNETFDGIQDLGSVIYDRGGTIKIEGDAYGTLILPYGTISNVLRVKVTTTYSDELQGNKIADYTDVSYQWYTPTNRNYLLSWGYLDASIIGGPPQKTYVGGYLDAASVGVEDNSFKPFAMSLSPNPTQNQFRIEYDSNSRTNMAMEIYDITGRMVYQRSIRENNGQINEVVNVDNLKTGLYSVQLKYNGGVVTEKLIIE